MTGIIEDQMLDAQHRRIPDAGFKREAGFHL
jgi:hypothetical protein